MKWLKKMENMGKRGQSVVKTLYYILVFFHPIIIPLSLVYFFVPDFIFDLLLIGILLFFMLPHILRKCLKTSKNYSILVSFFAFILWIILLLILGIISGYYYRIFSTEKWTDSSLCPAREGMIDSLEEKYDMIGMNKKEIYKILGNPNDGVCKYDQEANNDNKSCYNLSNDGYYYKYYCVYFNDNDIVVDYKVETYD